MQVSKIEEIKALYGAGFQVYILNNHLMLKLNFNVFKRSKCL